MEKFTGARLDDRLPALPPFGNIFMKFVMKVSHRFYIYFRDGSLYLSIYQSVNISIFLFIYLSIYPPYYPTIHLVPPSQPFLIPIIFSFHPSSHPLSTLPPFLSFTILLFHPFISPRSSSAPPSSLYLPLPPFHPPIIFLFHPSSTPLSSSSTLLPIHYPPIKPFLSLFIFLFHNSSSHYLPLPPFHIHTILFQSSFHPLASSTLPPSPQFSSHLPFTHYLPLPPIHHSSSSLWSSSTHPSTIHLPCLIVLRLNVIGGC